MRHHLRSFFRFLSIFFALMASSLLTGCGGGGGGGGDGGPGFAPLPESSISSTIEGYVSQIAVSRSVRSDLGASLTKPFAAASCHLFAFDARGKEIQIAEAVTNERGFYRFSQVQNPLGSRNLIIRAQNGGTILECVLPLLKAGSVVRASTMTPQTTIQADLVRQAARRGFHDQLNLAEVDEFLPLDTIGMAGENLEGLLGRLQAFRETQKKKFGTRLETLINTAFDLQQKIAEKIELGELSMEEARRLFTRSLSGKAKEMGIPAEDMTTVKEIGQTLFLPAAGTNKTDDGTSVDEDSFLIERVRERTRQIIEAAETSMHGLIGADPEFIPFFDVLKNLRIRLEAVDTSLRIRDLIQETGPAMVNASGFVWTALAKLGFKPDQFRSILGRGSPSATQQAGSETDTLTRPASPGVPTRPPSNLSPLDQALGLLSSKEAQIQRIRETIQKNALDLRITISNEQIAAAATLVWAFQPENLGFSR